MLVRMHLAQAGGGKDQEPTEAEEQARWRTFAIDSFLVYGKG